MPIRIGAALAVLGLAASCGAHDGAPAASPALLAEVEAIAATAQRERNMPGLSLVVLRDDALLVSAGYGVADVERGEPVAATTVFQLGSISKQFLAALVLKFAEQGRLSLGDPVNGHLPEFTLLPPEITIEHLLNHTSGIREPFTMADYDDGIEDLERTAEEFVEILQRAPVDFPAGSRWSYSNANYMLLALLVERLTGRPYERVLADELFRPLGLASLRHCTPLPQGPGEARGYVLQHGAITPSVPENMSWIRGDGGICGHALDVARWLRLLATGRVITPQSYRSMSTPTRLSDGRDVDYGFGLSLVDLDGRRKAAHNGAMAGFSASSAYYPDDALTVVVLTNRGGAQTESIERRIARRLLDMPEPELTEQQLSAHARRRYVGRYDIGVFAIRIAEHGEGLWLEMPPPGPTTPLRYLGNGTFASAVDPDANRLTFSGDDDTAAEVRLFMGALHWYGTRLR